MRINPAKTTRLTTVAAAMALLARDAEVGPTRAAPPRWPSDGNASHLDSRALSKIA
jgi:hypothetical protein